MANGEFASKGACCVVGCKKIAFLLTFGILLVIAGVTLYFEMDRYIQNKINDNLVLKPGSSVTKEWINPSVPIYLQFYIFDISNPMEAKQGKRPYLVQKGPYSYREHRPKQNVTWNSNTETVTYNEKMSFVFDAETSCDTCDPFTDIVTTVNIPLVTLAEAAGKLPKIARDAISLIFDGFQEKLYTKRRVQDLLWGYPDPIFKEYNNLRDDLPKFLQEYLPEVPFIIALQQNNTYDGVTSVFTGKTDISMLVHWMDWKGMTKLQVWKTRYANMINGTDGSQFAPGISKDDTLYVFVTQLCRSLYFTHETESDVHGIEALQFTVPSKAFLNATANPDNEGFCTKKCYPSGILDIGVCQPPSPIAIPLFISAPHFYLGDKSLLKPLEGLSPNKADHGTFLNIEPHIGISLWSSKRLQINVKVEPVDGISQTSGIPSMFFPVLYINETATIDSSTAEKLKSQVLSKFTLVHAIELGVVSLGGLLIIIAFILFIVRTLHLRKMRRRMLIGLINRGSETSPLLS